MKNYTIYLAVGLDRDHALSYWFDRIERSDLVWDAPNGFKRLDPNQRKFDWLEPSKDELDKLFG